MAFKKLRQFLLFQWDLWAKDKKFMVKGVKPWRDFNTKQLLGTEIETIITEDKTAYELKQGEQISNCFEIVKFKVPEKINVPLNSYIKPVDVKATVYGDYMNRLSVRARSVDVIK